MMNAVLEAWNCERRITHKMMNTIRLKNDDGKKKKKCLLLFLLAPALLGNI